MTIQGPGMFCKIEGRMDHYYYLKVLQRDLLDILMEYNLDPSHVIFQHDNDPKHTTKIVCRWLRSQDFDILQWLIQSPDLNLIEYLCSMLKLCLNQYETPPKRILEL